MIKANVMSRESNKILIDSGSSVEIFFKSTMDEIRIIDLKLEHINTSLKVFRRGRLKLGLGIFEFGLGSG